MRTRSRWSRWRNGSGGGGGTHAHVLYYTTNTLRNLYICRRGGSERLSERRGEERERRVSELRASRRKEDGVLAYDPLSGQRARSRTPLAPFAACRLSRRARTAWRPTIALAPVRSSTGRSTRSPCKESPMCKKRIRRWQHCTDCVFCLADQCHAVVYVQC